jgi:hypothetical protein
MARWHYLSTLQPPSPGRYLIKDKYGRVFEAIWNGDDFVLPIGYPITFEVVMWKFKEIS